MLKSSALLCMKPKTVQRRPLLQPKIRWQRQQVQAWRVLSILLDGKGHTLEAFEGLRQELNVCQKTIFRILRAWEDLAEFRVSSYKRSRDAVTFWRCDWKPTSSTPTYRTKRCSYCGLYKLLTSENFNRESARPDGYRSVCNSCQRQYNKEWRAKNNEWYKERARNYYRKNKKRILMLRKEKAGVI